MLETILHLQNQHWSGQGYAGLMERDQLASLIKKLALKEIQVLLGIRRSGKSTLFKLLINHLLKKEDPKSILYLNLDDPFFSEVWKSSKEFYSVIETAEKLTGVKPVWLFLDEVQNVDTWERFVKSAYDNDLYKKIFITGSNSSLLKSAYAKLLSGRYVVDDVMPLSFREILAHEHIKTLLDLVKKKSKILKMVEQLLFYGSFPEIWKTTDSELKREQLLSYYQTILLKDCVANHNVREIKKLEELALYLLSNNATLYSYNSLADVISSNENTVKQFIHIFEDSFLMQEVRPFSYSLKKSSKGRKKTYCVDNGLIHAISVRFSENHGRLFENLVYSELLKRGYKEIYFFNENKECDFIIKKGKEFIAVQATYQLTDQNRDREIEGLKYAMENLKVKKGYIVTFNSEEKVIGKNQQIIPFWKLFFQKDFFSQ